MNDELKKYIEDWHELELKPYNQQKFIDLFLEFLKRDDLVFMYHGEGAYFGKQIAIFEEVYLGHSVLSFEIAYAQNDLCIYTGNHNGFWVPQYVSMQSNDPNFQKLKNAIFNFIKKHLEIE